MIGNRIEQEIIELWNQDITAAYSINEIAKKLKRDYPYVHKKVTEFIDFGILKKLIIGRSYLCSINLDSDEAILLLTANILDKKNHIIKDKNTRLTLDYLLQSRQDLGLRIIFKFKEEYIAVVDNLALLPSHIDAKQVIFMDAHTFGTYLLEEEHALKGIPLWGYATFFEAVRRIKRKLHVQKLLI